MSITLPTGVTIRTVTFWYPADHLGITDWRTTLACLFDEDLRPMRRLLADPGSHQTRALLAAPAGGHPTWCAGGPMRLLDIAATGAFAARQATARYDAWSATGRIGARRPGNAEAALLHAGRRSYVTYHSLRRLAGDALIIMRTGACRYPQEHSPHALVDHMQQATLLLADAAPDDVLVTVAA
ncbi:hypothetical protein [Dactylosporangium sp. CA-139066]|uniref:hypothetical protein n=1 Tax=Dactylosporangium sp. CA-139066 TaxID=3239930 RepID=UPI003D906514